MKKTWAAAVLALALSIGCAMGAMADETAASGGQWQQEAYGWRYTDESGEAAKSGWRQIDGLWYHFDRDGYMQTGWQKIGSYYYCLKDTGDLTIGWAYNSETEKWHYFNPDGTFQKGWFQDTDGHWYWFSTAGTMANNGYKTIDGQRYYFFEDGKMAANQYVGLAYLDENGLRNQDYDIVIEGKKKESTVSSEIKDEITTALEKIPGGWIKYFVEHGWKIMYYPEKEYFSAPESDGSTYYIYHKLDTSYRKIKFCRPESLTQAFGEYMYYVSDLNSGGNSFALDLEMNRGNVDAFVDVPDYYYNETQFYFGKLTEAYLSDETTRKAMEEDSPLICETINKVIYSK